MHLGLALLQNEAALAECLQDPPEDAGQERVAMRGFFEDLITRDDKSEEYDPFKEEPALTRDDKSEEYDPFKEEPAPSGSADDVAEQPELEQGGGCHEEEWEEVAVDKDVDQDSEVEHYTSYYEQHYVTTADGQSLQVTED